MSTYVLVLDRVTAPAIIVHGGAGAYLKTTTRAQRQARGARLLDVAQLGLSALSDGGARACVLAAIAEMERDPIFNAGYGAKLQRDGIVRVSASLMDGQRTRMAAIYNAQRCKHPSALADLLIERGDRNLDGDGAARLMAEAGVRPSRLRTAQSVERWQSLLHAGDTADAEAAIGDSGEASLSKAREAAIEVPNDLEPLRPSAPPIDANESDRFGTVGALAIDPHGAIWACTSTGGRGHETPGRISDSPTPAGNYACPRVAISATGFGEQILDLNVAGRIATRVIDGATLEQALRRTFDEVVAAGGLLGVIAITDDGQVGYAHTTQACGVAWCDSDGHTHIDQHGRG